ncbi:ribonuclease R [Hathewaya proteolytica DSM 3090]|uniref:Ribonuclease R n=1 Tax=Hathewaya proteolytica DSM 3090 TaxID=1121331 RepID=A0A1M6NVM4_9CLOT|nr:ribonuclease R [Hathewaya proteolytica]SHJ99797.1 ribonuclease R [Hathewaya proteolytica DSM 3090]
MPENLRETLIGFMKETAYKPMGMKELSKIFNIAKSDLDGFKQLLSLMEQEGIVICNSKGHYGVPEKMGFVSGVFESNAKGFGFVIRDDGNLNDIFIPAMFVNGAMHGDKVLVAVIRNEERGKKCEGEIYKVVERANKKIVGILEDNKNFGFVVPENKRLNQDIFVSKENLNGAKHGQIVVAEIIKWPQNRRSPEGKIIEILGNKGDKGVDILSIIRQFALPEEFPIKVEKYAESVEENIPQEEYSRRKDLRNMQIVTIDGEDAKDLDDAVSCEKLENGNYLLGVHIADVTNYVKELNPLDKEALKRGTSVYLIDRVIPMLPKKLSNGVCSLNPKVDRLTLTCMMEIDKSGKVVSQDIFESIIKTSERMTYTDVNKILRDKDEETIEKYKSLYPMFLDMEALFKILNKKRMSRGAIDFDFQECQIILDETGKPIDIRPFDRAVANRIIEEFMLVCNETVAEYMYWAKMPFVYRIHEDPDEEKLAHFRDFVYNLGYVMKSNKEIHPSQFQEILEDIKGKKEEVVVSTLMLRSMMKARYSPECSGHFGLAARYYCHFTSPIRRYPDLMIHRIIKEYINGKINDKRVARLRSIVDEAALKSSERERAAMEAERAVDDLKKAEYMSYRIGNEYEGIISSVTGFGMFVELPNTIEGLVHITDLYDDYYIFDDVHLCLVGEHTKKMYKLGDKVKILVSRVNMDTHEIYFELVQNDTAEDGSDD